MKIQHYAIIFIIIILPFSIICKSKLNKKIDTINDQVRINNALDTATTDAVETLIELNDEFYALYEGETLDVTPTLAKESIKSFFKTLSLNNTLPFVGDEKFAENYFSPYIPAIVIVAYDGFYVYSVEENQATKTFEYVLSPKIPYAYEENGFIINFTLGNSIKLYATNGVLYEGEFKQNYIDVDKISSNVSGEYKQYHDILGTDHEVLNRLPQLTTDMSLIVYALKENGIRNIPNFLTTSKDSGKISMLYDYSDIRTDDNNNTTTKDDDVSDFHKKRREVIINTIVKVLNEKINNHNRYADMRGIDYEFYLPVIDDADWINAIDDISVMAFMQGIPIGTDSYYNSYALGGSRIVETNYIYGTSYNHKYHSKRCPELSGSFDNDGFPLETALGGSLTITDMFLNKIDAAKAGFNPCLICNP